MDNAVLAAEEALKTEQFEVARSGLDDVVKKFAARFQELNTAASQKGASEEAKKAAAKAEQELEEASETQQSFDRTFGLGEFAVFVDEEDDEDDEEAEDDNEVSPLDFSDTEASEEKKPSLLEHDENEADDDNKADDDHEAEESDEKDEADEEDENDESDEKDEADEEDE